MSGDETAIQKLVLGEKGVPPPPSPSPGQSGLQLLTNIEAGVEAIKSPVPNRTGITTGQQIVTTSGTPQQLPSQPVPDGFSVIIKAKKANTGTITVGGSKGDSSQSGTSHFKLAPNESVRYYITNVNVVWIDATVSGEGIEYTVEV